MPERPLTVITYAASASLAAVALVYFFNPNYLIDGDTSISSASTRKKGIVGLFNPANDCFINSVLQSLAGLGDLRLYLIRELHRRDLGGPDIYAAIPPVDKNGKEVDSRKFASLQNGEVTRGLKDMIDRLNERPIYKKTISASDFIRVLENAFATRISKSQQDAQELLQIVAERLSEEYQAGREARKRARLSQIRAIGRAEGIPPQPTTTYDDTEVEGLESGHDSVSTALTTDLGDPRDVDPMKEEEDGFPLEGQTEARVECQHCHFVPKASPTSFVMLNLNVPQTSSATLNDCIDAHFKTEYIEDYKCDKCRLDHAIGLYKKEYKRATSIEQQNAIHEAVGRLEEALKKDPEKTPEGVQLPDSKLAPKRKIARHIEITTFPKILVIHLSRSMFDPRSSSTKNLAKLSFPEKFPMGGLLNRRIYKLLGMVSHKGTHNNGHYETFRRQHLYAPFSTPHIDRSIGPYSQSATPAESKLKLPSSKTAPSSVSLMTSSPISSPRTAAISLPSTHSPSPSQSSESQVSSSTRPSSGSLSLPTQPRVSGYSTMSELPPAASVTAMKDTYATNVKAKPSSGNASRRASLDMGRFKRKKKIIDRWWRISDDKVKECKTAEVLSMQKEVYMLFYEIEKADGDGG